MTEKWFPLCPTRHQLGHQVQQSRVDRKGQSLGTDVHMCGDEMLSGAKGLLTLKGIRFHSKSAAASL